MRHGRHKSSLNSTKKQHSPSSYNDRNVLYWDVTNEKKIQLITLSIKCHKIVPRAQGNIFKILVLFNQQSEIVRFEYLRGKQFNNIL